MKSTPLLFTLLLSLVLGGLARAQQDAGEFLICYPNAPGSARSADPIMERLGQYLSDRAGSSLRPAYFNALEPAEAWLSNHRPRQGIVSLALYLRWREGKKLRAIAHAERGGSSEERYRLLVPQGSPFKTLEDLKGLGRPARIWSAHLDDPRFATNVVFQQRLVVESVVRKKQSEPAFKGGSVRVVSTTRALSALRRLKSGKAYKGEPVDAVLVDATVWRGLQQLKRYKGVFRVLYTAPSLPTPPVVAFGKAAGSERLGKVLLAMKKDSEGAAILTSLQVSAFTSPQQKRLAELAERYGAPIPGQSK